MSRTTLVASSLILLSALAQPHIADAGELVVVWLEDGRMLAGEVDPRTNDDRLWLRSSSRTFVVSTSAGWEQIKAVNAGGVRLPVDEFSKRMDEFLPKGGEPTELPAVASAGIPNVTTPVIRSIPQKNAATRVTSLDVEARVANWDQDAETDGVEIRVFPRNTFGELVPVSGQITATLVGRNQLPTREHKRVPATRSLVIASRYERLRFLRWSLPPAIPKSTSRPRSLASSVWLGRSVVIRGRTRPFHF